VVAVGARDVGQRESECVSDWAVEHDNGVDAIAPVIIPMAFAKATPNANSIGLV
jgi:hypothetical protein